MNIIDKVKRFLSLGSTSTLEMKQDKINLLKSEVSDIIDKIDENEESYTEMKEATANELTKSEGRDQLSTRLEERYLLSKSELVTKLYSTKKEIRLTEEDISKSITGDLEKGKNVMHYADSIVKNSKGDILMLLRCSDDEFEPNKWGLPGGKVEAGETPREAGIRELKEETNLDASSVYKIGEKKLKDGGTICFYNAYIKSDIEYIGLDSEEHCNYCFMSLEEIRRREADAFILDAKNTILQMIDPMYEPMVTLKKAHTSGQIDDSTMRKAITSYDSFRFIKED